MDKLTCEYCNKSFFNTCNLYKHQRTAKYCLKIQNTEQIDKTYICEYCDKKYYRSDHLKRHLVSCSERNKSQTHTDQLLDMISQLQKTIIIMANNQSNSNTVNNNNNNNRPVIMNNLQPLTDKDLQEHLDHLTLNYIQEGAKGYADFAGSYPFKDRLVCTDKSRKKLRYKDCDGELIDDGGGLKLTQRFFQAISSRNEEIINNEYRVLHEKVEKIAQDKSAQCSDLANLLTKATQLQELLIKCRDAAAGKENDLTKEFVNHLTKLL